MTGMRAPGQSDLGDSFTNEGRIRRFSGDSAAFVGKFFALCTPVEHIGKEKAREASQPATEQENKKGHQFTHLVCRTAVPPVALKQLVLSHLQEFEELARFAASHTYMGMAKSLAITHLSQINRRTRIK
jgi:hypothetical protein